MVWQWFTNKSCRNNAYRLLNFVMLLISPGVCFASDSDMLELDYVFADFQVDNRKTDVELELATRDYQHYFLSLPDFNEQFVASFTCNANTHSISGMFWEGALTLTLTPNEDYFIEDDLCYLNIEVVKRLGVRMMLDLQRQLFAILTQGKHPKTQQIKLDERKKILAKLKTKQSSRLQIDDSYQLASAPLLDFTANTRWVNNDHRPSLFMRGVFDFLYHQTDAQLNWQEQGNIRGRAALQRKLHWQNQQYHYQLGDIQVSRQSLFNVPSRGLGISIGEQRLSRQRTLIDLNGYTQPFSEVELYQDDLLVDFQALGDDGFYQFNNVDFREFNTQYDIRINTPDGNSQTVAVQQPGNHGIVPGQWQPSLVFLDSGQALFDDNTNASSSQLTALDMHYGLSAESLLSIGVEHQRESRENNANTQANQQWLAHATITGMNLAGINVAAKAGYANDWAYDLGLSTALQKHTFTYSHNRLITGSETSKSHSASWLYSNAGFSAGGSASQQGNAANRSRNYALELGYRSDAWSLSVQGDRAVQRLANNNNGSPNDGDNQDTRSGSVAVSKSIALVGSMTSFLGNTNVAYRANIGNFAQRSLNLSHNTRWFDINSSLTFRWDLVRKNSAVSLKLSKTLESIRLNGDVGYCTSNGWSAGLGVAFSLSSQDPLISFSSKTLSKSSSLYVVPFLDSNHNLKWDEDEALLPDVALRNRNRKLAQKAQAQHIALFGIKADEPQIFTVDDTALDNPYIAPQFEDIQIAAHPGSRTRIELPFHLNFELEGQIQLLDKDGVITDRVGQVPLHLYRLTAQGKTRQRTYYTEPDGFYVLDRLKSGHYLVKIDTDFLQKRQLACQPCEFNFDTNDADDHLLYLDDMILSHAISTSLVSQ